MRSPRRSCALGTCVRTIFVLAFSLTFCYFCVLLSLWTLTSFSEYGVKDQPTIDKQEVTGTHPTHIKDKVSDNFLYYAKRSWLKPAVIVPGTKKRLPEKKITSIVTTRKTLPSKTSYCSTNLPKYSQIPTRPLPSINTILPETAKIMNMLSGTNRNILTSHSITPNVCKAPHTTLLFVVFSEPGNTQQRNRIRHTWASLQYFKFDGETKLSRIDYFFVVGLSGSAKITSPAADLLIDEVHREHDILPLIVASSQPNRTSLHLLTTEWLLKHCHNKTGHTIFIEQDLIPNVPLLGSFIAAQNKNYETGSQSFYCFNVVGARPKRPRVRTPPQAFEVSKAEWPNPQFLPHCNLEQGGFVATLEGLRLWHRCSTVYNPFKLYHVFLTGILREAAGIALSPYWTTYGRTIPLLPSSRQEAGQHLFFSQAQQQPRGVWHGIFQGILTESLK